jgi:hypothetical protein
MKNRLIYIAGLLCLMIITIVEAQNTPSTERPAETMQFGKVRFQTSCLSEVETLFNEEAALLASFQYDLSRAVFAKVAQKDPHCAMAYWGQAMSIYHPLWVWPNAKTLKQGHADIDTAQRLGAKTDRERAYIRAAAIYYQDNSAIDTTARAIAYSDAMAEVHQHFSQDVNAAALYGLSLIAIRSSSIR